MEALLISADTDEREVNTSRYRILTPAKYLQKAGHTIHLQNNAGWEMESGGKMRAMDRGINYSEVPEVVLIERNIQPDWMEKLRLSGAKRIIITFDDHYGEMPDRAVAKPWWDKYYNAFIKALAMADLVIVPSMSLVEAYRPYCKRIQYVTNYIDDEIWAGVDVDKPKEKVIGWGGSAEHLDSWKLDGLGKALNRVLVEHPDWELCIFSNLAPAIAQSLPVGTKLRYGSWMPHTEWPKFMSQFGVGIAPLQGKYDRYRSNLKLVEYSMGKVPWVASALDPYTKHQVIGGDVVGPAGWYESLSEFVGNEQYRSAYGELGHEWAKEYLMSRNVGVYESILWPEYKREDLTPA